MHYTRKDDHKVKNELNHECELPPEEDVVVKYINTGMLVNLRRKFRHCLLLSEYNPRSKVFLRSTFVIRKEKNKHLKYHYYMIHPFSQFRAKWEMFMIIIMMISLFVLPFTILYHWTSGIYLNLAFDVLCFIDIIINFNTGFQSNRTNKIEMDRNKAVKHYLLNRFFVDILACFNIQIIMYLFYYSLMYKTNIHYVHFVKVVRLVSLVKYIDNFRDYRELNMFKTKVFKLIIIIFIVILWCWVLVIFVNRKLNRTNASDNHLHVLCYTKVIYMLLLFGSPDRETDIEVVIVEIVCFCLGFSIELLAICQILQIVTKYSSTGKKYYQMTQQLEEFMRYKSLPDSIRKRILSYFDFRFQRNYYKEGEILKMLSPQLRQEMLVHSYMHLLEKVNIFDDLPMSILSKIISHMKAEIYLPSDVVVVAGSVGDCMYFIASGTVAVYTAVGKEICHLSDGANFGEISLISETEHRVATVVAIDCCELFILNRKDFSRQLERYPEVFQRIRRIAQERVRKSIISSMGEENFDILSDLSSLSERNSKTKLPP